MHWCRQGGLYQQHSFLGGKYTKLSLMLLNFSQIKMLRRTKTLPLDDPFVSRLCTPTWNRSTALLEQELCTVQPETQHGKSRIQFYCIVQCMEYVLYISGIIYCTIQGLCTVQ